MAIRPLNKIQEEEVVAAIAAAENRTSGEIRVHIDKYCKGSPVLKAENVFIHLKMHLTEQRNGVLIFVATSDQKVGIVGDKGIHEKVGDAYWSGIIDVMITYFKEGDLTGGICAGVKAVGNILAEHYPGKGNDKNELSDDISFS